MLHLHLKECDSTQTYLKENYEDLYSKDPFILVSTDKQLNGIGRHGNTWDDYPNAITFSFLIKPDIPPIQIPLACGIILCNYIKEKWNLDMSLKWPNDLMNSKGQKCGGILCQYVNNESIICGIGLNLGKPLHNFEHHNYKIRPGVVDEQLVIAPEERKEIPKNFYDYYNTYNLPELNIKKRFEKLCSHINKRVSITDTQNKWLGIFDGISENGEAIITNEDGNKQFILSGSMEILIG